MSEYDGERRKRNQTLLVVEGNHEKNKLFRLIFECFPELNIDIRSIWIYGTNIYQLYEDIVDEYGSDWAEEETDIDLPFVLSKKDPSSTLCYKSDFTNIILVFDYERHDPNFSEKKIRDLQSNFSDMADNGQLYLNYPMVESYQHLTMIPDSDYLDRKVSVSLQPGHKYKELVGHGNFINFSFEFHDRIDDLLDKKYGIEEEAIRRKCCDEILDISDAEDLLNTLRIILKDSVSEHEGRTLAHQLSDWIHKVGYAYDGTSYRDHLRWLFSEIIFHNIEKAHYIQTNQRTMTGCPHKKYYDMLDMAKILNIQNSSSHGQNGFIWVLNTCVFIVAEYNFALIQNYE